MVTSAKIGLVVACVTQPEAEKKTLGVTVTAPATCIALGQADLPAMVAYIRYITR